MIFLLKKYITGRWCPINKVTKEGNIPKFISSFLVSKLPGEKLSTEVFSCTHDEMIRVAKQRKMELQVMIDRKTARSFMVGVELSIDPFRNVSPQCYFCELDAHQAKDYGAQLQAARDHVYLEQQARKAQVEFIQAEQKAKKVVTSG